MLWTGWVKVTKAIDEEFKAIGSTSVDVAQKVQAGANNGIKRLEDAGLTHKKQILLDEHKLK